MTDEIIPAARCEAICHVGGSAPESWTTRCTYTAGHHPPHSGIDFYRPDGLSTHAFLSARGIVAIDVQRTGRWTPDRVGLGEPDLSAYSMSVSGELIDQMAGDPATLAVLGQCLAAALVQARAGIDMDRQRLTPPS